MMATICLDGIFLDDLFLLMGNASPSLDFFLIIASHSRKVKVPGQGVTQVRGPYKRGGLKIKGGGSLTK